MKKGKILVVDDNQGIRSALKILLPAHFAEVEIIASPKSLVTTMESFRPDVVLLDMNFYTDINTGNEGLYCTASSRNTIYDASLGNHTDSCGSHRTDGCHNCALYP